MQLAEGDGWRYEPVPRASAPQRLATLMRGPCDGERINIGEVDELAGHIARHTQAFVHYYRLSQRNGLFVYEHHSVERRRCGK